MSEWSTVFLGVIAISALTVAAIQVGILIVATKLVKSATDGVAKAETALLPLVRRAEALSDQASEVLVKVTGGLERTERMMDQVGTSVARATHSVGEGLRGPANHVAALSAGIRAAAGRLGKKELL